MNRWALKENEEITFYCMLKADFLVIGSQFPRQISVTIYGLPEIVIII